MKSRKKKTIPVRAKRYNKKRGEGFEYDNLEARQLLAADFLSAVNYVGNTDLINLSSPVPVTEGVEILRSQLELGSNESLKLQKITTDQIGFQHFKYQQYYNDILVEGSSYSLHVKDSQIVSMSGDRVGIVAPVHDVQLSNEDAFQAAMDHIGASEYTWQDDFTSEVLDLEGRPEGELVYITETTTGQSIPTFKFDMWATDLGTRDYVYVNANTGIVELVSSRIRNADIPATGTSHYDGVVSFVADQVSATEFRLRQVADGVETYDNQLGARNDFSDAIDITSSSPFFDGPEALSGVSAHWGAENTLSFYQDWFGRDSYDDQSSTLVSYVNVQENWNNATWNGSVMQYGEGDGTTFSPLVEIDIVGHEITHGVTEFSAGLIYQNEMGALNESFSDIFGETVEYYATGTNDWLLGDKSFIPPGGLRSFLVPNDGNQADTYLGDLWFTGGGDNGGVHFNSGVQNKWYHILSEGEAGVNDNGDIYDVTGIGIEDAAQIAYRNLTTYLSPFSQYQDARDGAVQSALDLFGKRSTQHIATIDAWTAVGVYSQDITLTEFDEVIPGSRIFNASAVGDVPPGESRGVLMSLDAGQTISVIVDGSSNSQNFTVEDPGGNEIAASVDGPGNRTSVNAIAAATPGEYRINVGVDGIADNFKIEVILNATLESEIGLPISNGQFSDAQEFEDSSIMLPRGDRLGVFGEFEISEIPSITGYDFESGALDGNWATSSTDTNGRIRVSNMFGAGEGDYALFMDTATSGFDNLNEAIWTVDLSSVESTFLNFYYASFNDENTELPLSFNGTTDGDGVSVSDDGETWHTILTDSVTEPGQWNQFTVDLSEFAANVGIDLTSEFKIKFQQFDDDKLGSDGRAFDGISLTELANSEDWYRFDLQEGEVATLAVSKTFASGEIDLELYDSSGDLILGGTPGEGIESRISQFVAEETDSYFARLVGTSTPYGFVVTRGADFDTGSTVESPQDISMPMSVAGYVNTTVLVAGDPDAAPDNAVLDNFFDGVTLSNNVTGGSVYAVQSSFEAPTGIHVFAPSPAQASGWTEDVNEIRADFDLQQASVSIIVGAEESSEDVGFIRAYDSLGNQIDEQVSRPLEPGETQRISVFSASRSIAYIVAGGFQNDVTPLDKLTYEIAQDASDFYSINIGAGRKATADATFPGTGEFLFDNNLVLSNGDILFRMELIDSEGNVVATGIDKLEYFSFDGGTYVIRASAVGGDGDYSLDVTTEVETDRFSLGDLKFGVAAADDATGRGYLMFTQESVGSRFASSPVNDNNADHVVAVQYDIAGASWQYNNDSAWVNFTPAANDRLIAVDDFDNDTVESLEGLAGTVHGVNQGFETSDIEFEPNLWNGEEDEGEFQVVGTNFKTGDIVGDAGAGLFGIASDDFYFGEGYMLYSEQPLVQRFATEGVYSVNAPHVISVRFNEGTNGWEFHNNLDWHAFTPVANDRLLAHIDFATDVVTMLEGESGHVEGITQGFISSDIEFIANQWGGKFNAGEFGMTGSEFVFVDRPGSLLVSVDSTFDVGPANFGIASDDFYNGEGYLMYSEQPVSNRFSEPVYQVNSANVISVRFNAGSWEFHNNLDWHAFTPVSTDLLLAHVDFGADVVTMLEGLNGQVEGIDQGYISSDIAFIVDQWNGKFNAGEFGMTGSTVVGNNSNPDVGSVGRGVGVHDSASGTGFIMYSQEGLFQRFADNQPRVGNADHLIAVRQDPGSSTSAWQYSDNNRWINFVPTATDRLIADVDFDADAISPIKGYGGAEGGVAGRIVKGFFESDLEFFADQWNGESDNGEFQITGTYLNLTEIV